MVLTKYIVYMAEQGHSRSLSSKLGNIIKVDIGLNTDHRAIGLRFRNVFEVYSALNLLF